jgi:hypothetical protein
MTNGLAVAFNCHITVAPLGECGVNTHGYSREDSRPAAL